MKYLILFLLCAFISSPQDISIDNSLSTATFKIIRDSTDIPPIVFEDVANPMFLSFMNDSIRVKTEDYWGFTELILLEIEMRGYPFLDRLQKTKFLKLPSYILYQLYLIMEKKYAR